MNGITVEFTRDELALLTSLASDQLFRLEFIDPKMPGFRSNLAELRRAKDLVSRLRTILNPDFVRKTPGARIAG